MFRKIVSNLAFSPALVGQLSFYAKRLRKEETTRRLGLIFTALALVVQSLAVFSPPEAANASSPADFVPGGVSSLSDFINHYEKNTRDIKNIFSSLGITKAEIKAATPQTISGKNGYYNWSMTSLYSAAQGQKAYKYDGKTVYSRPINLTQQGGNTHHVYVGHSANFGWFAIKKDCGNLITKKQPTSPPTITATDTFAPKAPAPRPIVTTPPRPIVKAPPATCQYNPSLPDNDTLCQPCPDSQELWIKDDQCSAKLISSKSALNLTQGNIDATTKVANAADKIAYTITVKNIGLAPDKAVFTEDLSDVLEYANLIDHGSGSFDKERGTLTWPDVSIAAGEQQSRTFVVQLMSPLPLTNTGTSNEASYDCRMVNTFGNAVEIDVACAIEKVLIEQTVAELPQTGPTENILFGGTLLAIVTYFYARSRQVSKEVRLIRRNITTGVI